MSEPEQLIHAQAQDFETLLAQLNEEERAEIIFGMLAWLQSHLIQLLGK